jgi:hypothetical protein
VVVRNDRFNQSANADGFKRRTELGHGPSRKCLKSRGKNSNRPGQSEP